MGWGGVGWGGGQGRYWGEAIYSDVQCIMGNGHMGLIPCEQADMTENIAFSELLWWAVNLNIEGKSYYRLGTVNSNTVNRSST